MYEPSFERNKLLGALSPAQRERLGPHLSLIEPPYGKTLIKQDRASTSMYFPLPGAVLSLTRQMEDGTMIEVGVIGSEGVAGISGLLDSQEHVDNGVVQQAGAFVELRIEVLDEEIGRDKELRALLFRYTNAFLMQVTQTAVCNRLHMLEQRLARWLLMMHDRVGSDEMRMTQEFLAHMLGTRLAGVNEGIQSLERAGLIKHARQRVMVVDRKGLERASCECYAVAHEKMQKVVR